MSLVVTEDDPPNEPEPSVRQVTDTTPPVPPVCGWRVVHSSGETVVSDYPALVRCLREKPGARAFKLGESG